MRHLIDSLDLSVAETQEILDLADRIAADSAAYAREFDTLKSKKVPQSLEIGLFFCQIFIFII